MFDHYGEGRTGTTSMHIHKVSKAYFEDRNISVSHTSKWPPFITNDGICGNIENDRPVIMFGLYDNVQQIPPYSGTVMHAVVAYKFENKSFTHCDYTVHYGWNASANFGSHTAHLLGGTTASYYTVF